MKTLAGFAIGGAIGCGLMTLALGVDHVGDMPSWQSTVLCEVGVVIVLLGLAAAWIAGEKR